MKNRLNAGSLSIGLSLLIIAGLLHSSSLNAQSRDDVIRQTLSPYQGKSSLDRVNRSTLDEKVVCGYQGWFTCPDDGLGNGWTHYEGRGGRFEPGCCTIDLWPDVSDLSKEQRHPTAFRHADGRTAEVFSPADPETVRQHFQWMKEYGIDGAMVQRFAVTTRSTSGLRQVNTVLTNCRAAANETGRVYALMYDLSGLRAGDVDRVIDDWRMLRDKMRLADDPNDKAYLHHNSRPLVALWGLGFKDRRTTIDEWARLVRFFKEDPEYGQCSVMLGVPTGWRTLDRDCLSDRKIHDVIRMADIVSPWTVGRYDDLEGVSEHAHRYWSTDIRACDAEGLDYLPVIFPGFSWHNLMQQSGENTPLGHIPRQGGRFLWQQAIDAKRSGAKMLYVAMFDEVDEGTAIFKCTNDPPIGASPFLTYKDLPSDHYLWLTGQIEQMLREKYPSREFPTRE